MHYRGKPFLYSDNQAPIVNCSDALFVTDVGASTASDVTFIPAVWDNVDSSPLLTCSHPLNFSFPLGDTTVSCTASDSFGNVASCSFNVTVVGKELQDKSYLCFEYYEIMFKH